MFKKAIKIIFIIGILAFISSSFALSTKEKALMLENFKSLEYEMLFDSEAGMLDEEDKSALNLSRKVNIFGSIKDRIAKKRKYAQIISLQNMNKISSLEEMVAALDEDIDNMTKGLAKINTQIIDIKKEVNSNKKIINVLRKKIEENREVLLEYLVYIYKKGNYVYDENDIDNLKAIVFYGEDIGDIIDDLYFKGIIQITGKKLINDHRNYIKKLYLEKVSLEKKEIKLKSLRKNEIIERKIIKDKKDYKQRILDKTKGQEALFKKYISDKLKLESNLKIKELKQKIKFKNVQKRLLKKYDCEFIDLSKDDYDESTISKKCLVLNKTIASELKLKGFNNDGNNLFSWPIPPIYGMSTFFRDAEYKEDFGSDHDAIDIRAKQGTSVRAPADGYVIFVSPPVANNYAYFAIKHPNGYVTVYGHVNEILVKELDFVKEGDIIAKTGGEFGTLGAGLLTTGPHLHFEIFSDKEPVDPFNFLDLSIFLYDNLPEKYKYKFFSDFKARKGYEYKNESKNTKTFRLEGETETERQKYLLNNYATTEFKNWDIWVEEALDGNIDPTFIMCIGLAETGLGRNLKTRYNVGNIGNTDSGATKQFINPRSGIYGIVRTLNNDFLGNYYEIRQLSRYGNKTGYIYASSPDHWHNNIIKCMSAVKGIYVKDSYNFRLAN